MGNSQNTADRLPLDILYDEDLIVIYRGLDQELCRCIIDLFNRDNHKWRGKIIRSEDEVSYTEEIKNSWDLEILNEGAWQEIFQTIHPRIQACMSHYLTRSPVLRSFDLQISGYKIQMYPKNQGYFRWHADSVGKNAGDRVVAMVLYLNDVEKGGETEFYHQEIKIPPKAGQLVLFPSGWNYMHCGHTPESEDKYIIQTFVKIKR
jgi:hypothetical protein